MAAQNPYFLSKEDAQAVGDFLADNMSPKDEASHHVAAALLSLANGDGPIVIGTSEVGLICEKRGRAHGAYTTGPWFYDSETGNIQMDDRNGDDIQALVATVNFENADKPQADADGRLIAAAPDMLAALERLAWALEPGIDQPDKNLAQFCTEARQVARNALRNAKGITEHTNV